MTTITRAHSTHRMSQLNVHNGTVYLAGQVPEDFSADIQDQARSSLARVDALLAEAGSSKDHILSVTIYLKDMADFAAMNEVWDAWIADHPKPARACVAAEMALPEILVEYSVIAAVKA